MAEDSVAQVIPQGDRRDSLVALRDLLAGEVDDAKLATHRRDCVCHCGMADLRALVALTKQISALMAEIDSLPETEGKSKLDDIVASVATLDTHRRRRAPRGAAAAGS